MPNTREKLIELLETVVSPKELLCDGEVLVSTSRVADHLIANGVTAQEWISTSVRLPNEEEYTARAEDGTEYYVRFLIAYKTDIVEYEIGYYDGYKWMTEMPIRLLKDVVAWMPFPNMSQPSKGE